MSQYNYSPGLHLLMTLQVDHLDKLTNSKNFIDFSQSILDKYHLEQVGISVHDFENKSYTIAICLKESHICIHTWPEFHQLTLDVYLCNYLQDNTNKVRAIADEYKNYFDGTSIKEVEINR